VAQSDTPFATDAPACFSTYTRGTGPGFLRICVSDRGNILQFESPEFTHHLTAGEGYAVCTDGNDLHGYDAGVAQAGFGDPAITQPKGPNTFPLTIVRTTTDGVFMLAQSFTLNASKQELSITMTLTNLLDTDVSGVILQRYFDGNVNNTRLNRYASTIDSVWAWVDLYGLMLTLPSRGILHDGGVETFETWDPFGEFGYAAGCGSAGVKTPTPRGDYVGRAHYIFEAMQPFEQRTARFLYRRF
jgi:hypothetical protein